MSFNLIDFVKESLGNQISQQLSSHLGADQAGVSNALDSAIPTLLGGLINKGSDEKGAGDLLDFIGQQKFDKLLSGNIGDLLGNQDQSSGIAKNGLGILSFLFGGDSKVGKLMDIFGKTSGLGASGGGLLKMIAPFVLSSVGSYAKSKALGASGLASLFASQKNVVSNAIPAALSSELGFAAGQGGASASRAAAGSTYVPPKRTEGKGGLGKFLPYLLGLAALLFIGSYLRSGNDASNEIASSAFPDGNPEVFPSDADVAREVGDPALQVNEGVGEVVLETDAASLAEEARIAAAEASAAAAEQAAQAVEQASEAAGSAKDALGAAAGGIAAGVAGVTETVGDAVEKVGEGAAQVVEELGSISLPGGSTIEAPKGSFTEQVVQYLGSSEVQAGSEKAFNFDRVKFETGSANLTQDSNRQVSNLASILTAYPEVAIRVEGHTDNTGDAQMNLKLSQQRAEQVRGHLMSKGVPSERVKAVGLGQGSPVANNETPAGRAENRRVSVVITQGVNADG